MPAPTKSMGVLISQGLVVLGTRPPVSYTEFSISSLLMKCSGSNLFTEIRSLDSVPGPASNRPVEGEQMIVFGPQLDCIKGVKML